MGLGDSLYLQSVARHLTQGGSSLRVCSNWPDVFGPIADKIQVVPFTRQGVDIVAHYTMRKGILGTTQFQDCCISAGIKEPVDLRLDWKPVNQRLIDGLKSHGKPVVCVQLPRNPMGRVDGFGAEILPDCSVLQRMIYAMKDRALIVQIGSGKPLYQFAGIDVDLANRTSVSDLLDVASVADGFLGYCSFLIPLAESFAKPAMLVWSSRGLKAASVFVRQITPAKALHRSTSKYVIDDWTPERIDGAMDDFLR